MTAKRWKDLRDGEAHPMRTPMQLITVSMDITHLTIATKRRICPFDFFTIRVSPPSDRSYAAGAVFQSQPQRLERPPSLDHYL
jgi:hypothetical protein